MEKGLIFTFILTYGGAAAALINPFWGLVAYVSISLIMPNSLWHWSVPPGPYSFIVGAALFVGWTLNGCGTWKLGRAKPILFCLLGYFFWSAVCAVFAVGQKDAWDWVEYLAKIVFPFLVAVSTIDSVKKIKVLAWAIVICNGYLAFEFNLSYFSGYNRLWSEGFGGMDNNCMVVALVASLGMGFFLGMEAPNLYLKAIAFGSCAFMGHAILFSFSRGAMMATVVLGLVAFYLIPKTPRTYAAFALAIVAAVYLAGPQVRQRLFSSFLDSAQRDSSAQSRLVLWSDTFDCFLKNPIVGVGPRNWPLVAEREYGWLGAVKEAHTLWLQTLAQLGLPGFLCLAGFYGVCIWRLWPIARGKQPVFDPWLAVAARMIITALVGFAFAAQFVSIEPLEAPFFITMVGFGILRVASYPPANVTTNAALDREEEPPPPPPPLKFPNPELPHVTIRLKPSPKPVSS